MNAPENAPSRFRIDGEIVPYTRVGRERWTDRATRYLGSRDRIAAEIRAQAGHVTDADRAGPWSVVLVFRRHVLRGDLDNLAKAVLDAAEGILWDDDSTVLRIEATREFGVAGRDIAYLSASPLDTALMPSRWRKKRGIAA